MIYAGFWRRFLASAIDGLVVLLLIVPPAVTISTMGGIGGRGEIIADLMQPFLLILIPWIYWACLESSKWQATIGKKAIGIAVTDTEGNPISFGKATVRHFGKFISAAIVLVGFIMAGFTAKRQSLHDVLARCVVILRR